MRAGIIESCKSRAGVLLRKRRKEAGIGRMFDNVPVRSVLYLLVFLLPVLVFM
jgi:hypothetical protein